MDQFGNQMPGFTGNSDNNGQRPQSQPQQPNAPTKLTNGAAPKPHHNGCADVKPRLTKEQHDILEAHFQQQNKPSTSVKKGFAESLQVPLDKVNNWFQNRRAKVKQDLKKSLNQYNMSMGILGTHNQQHQQHIPMVNSQFQQHTEQSQPQHPMVQDFYQPNADISPTCLPVQSVEGPSALELGSQISLHQPFDMHALRPIPEADRGTYHPGALMQSFMAATAGASYMQNGAATLPQDSGYPYNHTGLQAPFQNEIAFSVPNAMPTDPGQTSDAFGGFPDFSSYEYSGLVTKAPANAIEAQHGVDTASSEPSPFSGAHSTTTPQSSNGPNASSVTSIASVYSGWTEEQKEVPNSNDCEDTFDQSYNIPQASTSDQALSFWGATGQGQAFSRADMYQHTNASAHAILTSPDQSDVRKLSGGTSDFDTPTFGDDAFARRNSSTTNLASNIEAIHIQNGQTPDGFRQPSQPSSIAARRQKRPTALNPSTLRSASYTSGMPSPGGSSEHTLRRIRSSGIPNAAGRIQKSNPGSAQRSPMALTFAEAAASPKFARTFSSSSNHTAGQGGSLAPPTPLTPNEFGRFPNWHSSTVIRNHPPMPEHSSPESLNANWTVEPQSAGLYSSAASPPSSPLDLGQLNHARLVNENLYRDTPPQSAPATQQSFPRPTAYNLLMPHMRSGFHSTTDLTIAQPKPSHFRRPSLPDTGHPPLDETHMQFPMQFGEYDTKFGDMSLHGISHNIPFAPPIAMPEFLVHEYSPPQGGIGPGTLYRRTTEPQPKSYIFANQGPGDFKS